MRIFLSYATLLFTAGLLTGCSESDEVTLEEACEADSNICQKVQADSRCRQERKDMILARHKVNTTRDKNFAFDALITTEKFVQCAELAQGIQYLTVKQKYADVDSKRTRPLTVEEQHQRKEYGKSTAKRRNQKKNNFRYAEIELRKLEEWTSFSKIPELAFYHWTRHGNKEAIKRLVKLDSEGKLNIYWLQYEISMHYAKFDTDKALIALYNSLILYPEDLYLSKKGRPTDKKYNPLNDEGYFHFNILRNLASLHFKRKNYEASYIYAKVLTMNNDITADISLIIEYMESNKRNRLGALNKAAKTLDNALSDGEVNMKYLRNIETLRM